MHRSKMNMTSVIKSLKIDTLNYWNWSTEPHFVQRMIIENGKLVLEEYVNCCWPLDLVREKGPKKEQKSEITIERDLDESTIQTIFSAFTPFLEGKESINSTLGQGGWKMTITDEYGKEYRFVGSYTKYPFVDSEVDLSQVVRQTLGIKEMLVINGTYKNSLVLANDEQEWICHKSAAETGRR